VAMIRAEMTNL